MPEQRRAQLLRCAVEAFAEYGVARATHAHVAARAGVSVSAVHSYFRTREDLVSATLGAVEANLMTVVASADDGALTATQALRLMVVRFDHAAQEQSEMIKVWLDWSTGIRADVWPRYLRMQEKLHDAVRRALVRGKRHGVLSDQLDDMAGARLLVGGGHTIALMRFAGIDPSEIAILIDHLVESITSIGNSGPILKEIPLVPSP